MEFIWFLKFHNSQNIVQNARIIQEIINVSRSVIASYSEINPFYATCFSIPPENIRKTGFLMLLGG